MKDEFTTLMHADMLGWSKEDAMLIEAYAQIRGGGDKAEVCIQHGFSTEYYDENIEGAKKRCFGMDKELDYAKLREMIARCEWTFAKTMPYAPHEYIVRGKCPLTTDEFEYFVNMQREHGVREHWGNYYFPYLYIDDYKYWTMGASLEETTVINRAKMNVIKEACRLYNKVESIRKEVESKQPHLVNTIYDLEPGETKVSKILAGFFLQRINGKYQVLESFVRYAYGERLASQIEKPIVIAEDTVEDKKRIDILVYEKGKYAIVFENKIWDAEEQKNQLANYIKGMKAKKYDFKDSQIYIIYLPSTDEHGPTDKSWNKSLQKSFEKRFKNISFKEGIIEWLESEDLQKINDECFVHSRFLFIDYLKRVFNLTKADNMENQKIDEFIRKELDLKDNYICENITKLTTKYNEFTECLNQLERIRKEYCGKMLKEWSARLIHDFPNCKKYEVCKGKRMCTGIVIPYNNIEDAIYINLEFIDKKVCYGATYMPDSHSIREEMQASELIRPFWENKEFVKGVDWLFYKYINVKEGYECLRQLIERIMK